MAWLEAVENCNLPATAGLADSGLIIGPIRPPFSQTIAALVQRPQAASTVPQSPSSFGDEDLCTRSG